MDNIKIIYIDDGDEYIGSLNANLSKVIINDETVFERKEPLYKIIAIIGPSGCGKTTIMNKLGKSNPNESLFHKLIFSTSRPRRENESIIDYHFYSEEDFLYMVERGYMLQYSCFNGWYYGLDNADLSGNKINVGIFSPEAIFDVKEKLGNKADIKIFYISTPDKVRLLRSLEREENPNVDEIIRRYEADDEDFAALEGKIDYTILPNEVDEDLDKCVQFLTDAITGQW